MNSSPSHSTFLGAVTAIGLLAALGRAQVELDVEYGDADSRLGSRIANVGDYDSDGYPDRLFGCPELGHAFLYSGAPDPYFGGIPELGIPPLELSGLIAKLEGGPGFGTAAVGGFDLDLDGKPDFAISQSGAGGNVTFFRGGDGSVLRVVYSPSTVESFGRALCMAGDLDGDGVPEVAIGSTGGWAGESVLGRIYFYSYAKDDFVRILKTSETAYGPGTFGDIVVNVGDVDDDGIPEIASTIRSSAGTNVVPIYAGSTGAVVRQFVSPVAGNEFGSSLVGVGPIGPQGHEVIAIGAPYDDSYAGAVYCHDAVTGALLHRLTGSGSRFFGRSLAATEDPNAPGAHTLLVGAPGGWYLTQYPGRVFVFDGPTSILLAVLQSTDSTDGFGSSIAALGNTHGDSRSEFAVGAPEFDSDAGRAFVYSGVTPCGSVKDLGGACIGSFGITPRLEISGCPRATTSTTLEFEVAGGPHYSTYGLLFLGAFDGSLKLSSTCALKFGQIFGSPVLLPIVPNGAPFPMSIGSGKFSATATIPATGYAFGFRTQMVIADSTSPFGFSATNGVEIAFSP